MASYSVTFKMFLLSLGPRLLFLSCQGEENKVSGASHFAFKELTHMSTLLLWLGLSHVTTPNYKGGWEM